MRKSIFLTLGLVGLATAIGCGSTVVRSGANGTAASTSAGGGGVSVTSVTTGCEDNNCTDATGGNSEVTTGGYGGYSTDAATGGYGGYYEDSSTISTTSGGGGAPPCDDETMDCGFVPNAATITRWADVPPVETGSGDETVSTTTGGGGGNDPNDLYIVIGAPSVSCALPFGNPNQCTNYDQISFTIDPSQLVDGAIFDLESVSAFESMQSTDCSGGGGSVFGGYVEVTIKNGGEIHLTLNDFQSEAWGAAVLYDQHFLATKCFSFGP